MMPSDESERGESKHTTVDATTRTVIDSSEDHHDQDLSQRGLEEVAVSFDDELDSVGVPPGVTKTPGIWWTKKRIGCLAIMVLVAIVLVVGGAALLGAFSSDDSKEESSSSAKEPHNPLEDVTMKITVAPHTPAPDVPISATKKPTHAPTTKPPTPAPPTTQQPVAAEHHGFLPDYTLQAIAENSTSPQALALKWVTQHPEFKTMPLWRKHQLMALTTLYEATGGNTSWYQAMGTYWLDASVNECDWPGVPFQCNDEGQFDHLDLIAHGMRGSVPPEIALLTHLTGLVLMANHLTGTLPIQMVQMKELTELAVSNNDFSGPIAEQLRWMSADHSLEWLDMHDNHLTGPLPTELGMATALSRLSLGDNTLTGTIPSEIASLPAIKYLGLYHNQLTGSIPSEIGMATQLTGLSLMRNQLTGSIPSEMQQMSQLHWLYLYATQVEGEITCDHKFANGAQLYVNCELITCCEDEPDMCQCEAPHWH